MMNCYKHRKVWSVDEVQTIVEKFIQYFLESLFPSIIILLVAFIICFLITKVYRIITSGIHTFNGLPSKGDNFAEKIYDSYLHHMKVWNIFLRFVLFLSFVLFGFGAGYMTFNMIYWPIVILFTSMGIILAIVASMPEKLLSQVETNG